MQRRKVIAGNWKMHKTAEESTRFVRELTTHQLENADVGIILCAPFTSLYHMSELVEGTPVGLGAQNVHWEESGAFTGEIAPAMLTAVGTEYVIIGHSERRQYYGETNKSVGKKADAALEHGLKPIICIGETLEQREADQVKTVIEEQLSGAFDGMEAAQPEEIMIAYEPVWAIGTGVNATPEQAVEAHQLIREWLDQRFGEGAGAAMTVLYGGSMKPANAESLLENSDIDGGLIGGASLQVDSFYELIQIASRLH